MHIYIEASNIVKLVKERRGSVKNLVFSSNIKNKKSLYALVCETLKYHTVLAELLERTCLLKLEKKLRNNAELGAVLLYDQLLGQGVTGKFENIMKKHKSFIHSQGELMKVRAGVTSLKQLVVQSTESTALNLPKYVRVNTIKTDKERVVKKFQIEGWQCTECTKDSFQEVVTTLETNMFTTDPHIPDLLVFPASTDFHRNKLYSSGEIILQDKASCFPAHLLSPPAGSTVIDCCAAPGNKTSHLACLMQNKGKIYAFDKDPKRLSTLKSLMQKVGATCVEAKSQDFLSVNPQDDKYRKVEYVLVDPSCSGTGMVNRVSQNADKESISEERLEQLSKFQITILKHAFKFPSIRRVVYSTCSIHEKENEHVVEEVLSHVSETFELRHLLPDWPERGVRGYEHALFCLRMSHDSALTNGFFVACFERKNDFIVDQNGMNNSERNTETVEVNTINTVNGDAKINLHEKRNKHSKKRKKSKHQRHLNENKLENLATTSCVDILETTNCLENLETTDNYSHKKKRKKPEECDYIKLNHNVVNGEKEYTNFVSNKRKKLDHSIAESKIGSENSPKTDSDRKGQNDKLYKKRKKKKQKDNKEMERILEKTFLRHGKSCKKKRKKSKQREVIVRQTEDISKQKHGSSCKKKRKKSKERLENQ